MFTCNTCSLQFSKSDDQRIHMKTEWHRYNLKRKVAQLPSISEELFNSKVASLQSQSQSQSDTKTKQVTKKEQRRKEKEAILEQKRAIYKQAEEAMTAQAKIAGLPMERTSIPIIDKPTSNDLEEKEAKEEKEKEQEEAKEQEEVDEEILLQSKVANKTEIPTTTCLFAHPKYGHQFSTVDENVEHMFKQHGLYIPEATYLIDKEGLIEYLGEKIGFGFCIACNYQGKNAEAAREHMSKKRHMKIPYETEDEKLEISKFYDFSSTYDDVDDVVDEDLVSNPDDWEDISGDDDGEEQEEEEEEEEKGGKELPSVEKDAIYQAGNELILPSGAIIGHRSNARYYRQNLAPERELSEGQGTVIAAETRHMLTLRDRKELAEKKRNWKTEKKREDVNDRRAAKFINNQPHFRDQLLQ
ncbi:REI1 [Candida oxycetoniae]|uniref:REI1 n=1 Tax=Candida oxycetoniae TaxID=497107 RepID=A0AAI9T128_9ASCO|nr:REI1 [Candida oxycetoniae]KAI3406389.2 REI1 [Candida oxycetoniae]